MSELKKDLNLPGFTSSTVVARRMGRTGYYWSVTGFKAGPDYRYNWSSIGFNAGSLDIFVSHLSDSFEKFEKFRSMNISGKFEKEVARFGKCTLYFCGTHLRIAMPTDTNQYSVYLHEQDIIKMIDGLTAAKAIGEDLVRQMQVLEAF